jgi:hypothetical protein
VVQSSVEVGVEAGSKRVFACALEWPGWCRSGRDEASALGALDDYGPRYAAVVRDAKARFPGPEARSEVSVVERVDGNATTDFGAPDGLFANDDRPVDRRALTRILKLLNASWSAFDLAVDGARGVTLRTGPRGGGRDLDAIIEHVVQAEASYGGKLAARIAVTDDDRWAARSDERSQVRDALTTAVLEGLPDAGPRGGKLWLPRRFIRRAAWHVLDHAWEIEDRAHYPSAD